MNRSLLPALALAGCAAACNPPATPASDGGTGDGATASEPTTTPGPERSAKPPVAAAIPMWVADKEVDCEGGAGPMKCLRIKRAAGDEWELLYQTIEGFTHEAGNEYELRVEREAVAKPPADGSSARYRLVEVVSKKKTAP